MKTKILSIHHDHIDLEPSCVKTALSSSNLSSFKEITPCVLSTLISLMASKSCNLDAILGSIMKQCFDLLLPTITQTTT